jgi:hypothetical protein
MSCVLGFHSADGAGGRRLIGFIIIQLFLYMALTSPASGGRSVGVVRSRTQATEFSLVLGC